MKKEPNSIITFYGPFGGKNGKHLGGGESGNRKTLALMKKLGFTVILLEKPYPSDDKTILNNLVYILKLIFTYMNWLSSIIFSVRNRHFHLSGFYNHLIYIEWLYVTTCKVLGIKTIYEIRAGGAILSYEQGSEVYRRFFRKTVSNADVVLCQGLEYVDFVNKLGGSQVFYYPNFILNEFIKEYDENGRSKSEKIKLIYFGRIAPEKNIEFILQICEVLEVPFHLDIVGNGTDKYVKIINDAIDLKRLNSNITIHQTKSSEELQKILLDSHFFVFPSKEPREGHSNALTEAMSVGVVPIASNQGFNGSVIDDNFLMIDEYIPSKYALKIQAIWAETLWKEYSVKCYNRVVTNYTEAAVENIIMKAYK